MEKENTGKPDPLIYNVTTLVAWEVITQWLQWMQDVHIPEILGTGCFEKHQLVKLLDTDEAEGPTYAVQYYAASKQHYEQYLELYAPALRKAVKEKWGEKILSFRTLMAIVQ
jgi:hypothetical protein